MVCAELLVLTWEKIPYWMIPWWFQVCVWEQCGKLIQLGGGCVFGVDHQPGSEQWPCSARTWTEPLLPLENHELSRAMWGHGGEGNLRPVQPQGHPWSLGPCEHLVVVPCPCWGGCAPRSAFSKVAAVCAGGSRPQALLSPCLVCSSCVCATRAPARWRGRR